MPVAYINGININYQRSGSGPRLLFLNGSGATLALIGPMLAMIGDGFDMVAHDQRGLGLTEIPPGPYEMADYAADAAGLAQSLGWQTYRVAGVSFGGMVAQELAVTYPERIERLALLCTSPGGTGGSSYPLHTLKEMDPIEQIRVRRHIMDSRFTDEWLAEHPVDRMLAEALTVQVATKKSAEVMRGEAAQLDARSRHDVYNRLTRIACPTLVACGQYDGIAPPENGRAIVGKISDSEIRLYEGGHAFFYQDQQAFPDITNFLKI